MKTTTKAAIITSYSADYTTKVQHAQREADGQWFRRRQERGLGGYRWTAWTATPCGPDHARPSGLTARLPAVGATRAAPVRRGWLLLVDGIVERVAHSEAELARRVACMGIPDRVTTEGPMPREDAYARLHATA